VGSGEARAKAMRVAIRGWLKRPMSRLFPSFDAGTMAARGIRSCDGCHIANHS
jgi:hypothetical protein